MNSMNIYLIERTDAWKVDEYDSWVVFAADKPQALCVDPSGRGVSMYREVKVTLLGTSFEETETKVICASFRNS